MKGALADNKIHAVATSGPQRTPYLKEVPTAAESGVPGYDVTSWNGIFVPHGTPDAVVNTLNKAMQEVLVIPEVKQKYLDLGVEAKASAPSVLMDRMKGDIDKWAAVIEKAGIPKL
jgi:tripartite-type tricarboxylate transporter receptor subunit TctC